MTSGHFIGVHMYMKSPRDNMLALYVRDVVTMVSKNFSLLRIRRKKNALFWGDKSYYV